MNRGAVLSALGKSKASTLQYLYLAKEGAHCPENVQDALGRLHCGWKAIRLGVGTIPAATLSDLYKAHAKPASILHLYLTFDVSPCSNLSLGMSQGPVFRLLEVLGGALSFDFISGHGVWPCIVQSSLQLFRQ